MAIATHPEWPDVPVDRDAFYQDLQEFHHQRGTTLDPIPKVSTQPIDLYDLFHVVQESGGYDEVSGKKLEWRRLAERQYSLGGNQNAAAYAFQLKSLFYRNLAAYAIARVYKQDPPPKEILEEITAKGGNLLKRTRESFTAEQALRQKPQREDDDSGSDRERDREREREAREDAGQRTSRLRQAPPQRQFFQPDVASTRQARQIIHQVPSPQPMMLPQTYPSGQSQTVNVNSPSFQLNSWDGRNLNAGLHVRPVPTPSNNEAAFQEKIKRMRQQVLHRMGREPETRRPLLPGTGYPGPNIYRRSLLALKSGIPAEVDFALFHLLKASSERGATFYFKHYPGLADALINEGLKMVSLFYNVNWEVSWRENFRLNSMEQLDGYRGTPDLLDRIAKLQVLPDPGELPSDEYLRVLERGTQVALILRNMSLSDENAIYLRETYPLGDMLTIWMNMPQYESLIELQGYVLEMVAQLSFWWSMAAMSRPLYLTLVKRLNEMFEQRDRGARFLLHALARIGSATEFRTGIMNVNRHGEEVKPEAEESRIDAISPNTIRWVLDWLLLDDDKILNACIDFLYRYFSSPRNTAVFLQACGNNEINHEPYFSRFMQLIRQDQQKSRQVISHKPAIQAKAATEILTIPDDLKAEIEEIEEPKRAHTWLRCLFEEDERSDIKQIALWQAYQRCWTGSAVQLLQASEFIKNVSEAFEGAMAQVINGAQPRFIIKGIRCRHVPVTPAGEPYLRCRWTIRIPVSFEHDANNASGMANHDGQHTSTSATQPNAHGGTTTTNFPKYKGTTERSCGSFQRNASQLWEHILTHHLGMHRNAEGKWDLAALREEFSDQHLFCKWAKCRRFQNDIPGPDPFLMGMHIKMHMPDTTALAAHRAQYTKIKRPEPGEEVEPGHTWPEETQYVEFRDTTRWLFEGREQLALVPVHICLVLRMLVRTVPKAVAFMKAHAPPGAPQRETHEWLQLLMGITWDHIWELIAYDRTLAPYLYDIVNMVQQGMEDEDGNIIATV